MSAHMYDGTMYLCTYVAHDCWGKTKKKGEFNLLKYEEDLHDHEDLDLIKIF